MFYYMQFKILKTNAKQNKFSTYGSSFHLSG